MQPALNGRNVPYAEIKAGRTIVRLPAMLAYGCGIGIGGRHGGGFEACVSDRICGAGGGRERALTVETRRAACDGIGVIRAGLRAGAATGGAGCVDRRRSMRLSGFSACSLAISRVNRSWLAASCSTV